MSYGKWLVFLLVLSPFIFATLIYINNVFNYGYKEGYLIIASILSLPACVGSVLYLAITLFSRIDPSRIPVMSPKCERALRIIIIVFGVIMAFDHLARCS